MAWVEDLVRSLERNAAYCLTLEAQSPRLVGRRDAEAELRRIRRAADRLLRELRSASPATASALLFADVALFHSMACIQPMVVRRKDDGGPTAVKVSETLGPGDEVMVPGIVRTDPALSVLRECLARLRDAAREGALSTAGLIPEALLRGVGPPERARWARQFVVLAENAYRRTRRRLELGEEFNNLLRAAIRDTGLWPYSDVEALRYGRARSSRKKVLDILPKLKAEHAAALDAVHSAMRGEEPQRDPTFSRWHARWCLSRVRDTTPTVLGELCNGLRRWDLSDLGSADSWETHYGRRFARRTCRTRWRDAYAGDASRAAPRRTHLRIRAGIPE